MPRNKRRGAGRKAQDAREKTQCWVLRTEKSKALSVVLDAEGDWFSVIGNKKGLRRQPFFILVPRARIELATRGFSVRCSTD